MASAMTHGDVASDPFQGSAPSEVAESSAMAAAAANPQQVLPASMCDMLHAGKGFTVRLLGAGLHQSAAVILCSW